MGVGSLLGVGFAVLAAAGLAVQSLAVRVGTRTRSIADVLAALFAVNLLVLVPLTAVRASPDYGLTVVGVVAFAAAGVFGSLLARLSYVLAIARIGASRTEPLKSLLVLVAVAMAVVFLGERVTAPLLAGVMLLLVGGIVVAVDARHTPVAGDGRPEWVDLAFPLGAALGYGVDPVITKVGLATGASTLVGVTVRVVAAAGGFGLYLGWRAARGDGLGVSRPNRWLVVAGIGNTVYLLAYYAALASTPVSVVTPVLGVSSLFVVAGAAAFLRRDERVTWRLVAGAVLVVLGIALVVRG